MNTRLDGKRALVTGASSGMGRAIAEGLAAEGAAVAVHGRTEARAADTVTAIAAAGGRALAVGGDLLDSGAIRTLCEAAIEWLGGIDIVVSNAGVADYARIVDMDEAMWDRHLDTNLKAAFLVARWTLPAMLAQGGGGRYILNASTNGKTADAEWTAYNASKHGLIGFMRCMAAEVGSEGITVNAICPGWIETKMATGVHGKLAADLGEPYEEVYRSSMTANMLGALLPPETIADMAVYLASDRGRFITGQAMNVCAGLCYW